VEKQVIIITLNGKVWKTYPCDVEKKFVLWTENWYHYREKIQKYTKFSNFTGLHFLHLTTFYNQALQFR
jgi:hypothetical protein